MVSRREFLERLGFLALCGIAYFSGIKAVRTFREICDNSEEHTSKIEIDGKKYEIGKYRNGLIFAKNYFIPKEKKIIETCGVGIDIGFNYLEEKLIDGARIWITDNTNEFYEIYLIRKPASKEFEIFDEMFARDNNKQFIVANYIEQIIQKHTKILNDEYINSKKCLEKELSLNVLKNKSLVLAMYKNNYIEKNHL